jgi:hypothetical protein
MAESNGEEAPRWWVEKSLVRSRADRQQGNYALGKALWSPKVFAHKLRSKRPLSRCDW